MKKYMPTEEENKNLQDFIDQTKKELTEKEEKVVKFLHDNDLSNKETIIFNVEKNLSTLYYQKSDTKMIISSKGLCFGSDYNSELTKNYQLKDTYVFYVGDRIIIPDNHLLIAIKTKDILGIADTRK